MADARAIVGVCGICQDDVAGAHAHAAFPCSSAAAAHVLCAECLHEVL